MIHYQLLDPEDLLAALARCVPDQLRPRMVIIGSIAAAWSFRDLVARGAVATKDVDLVLHPALTAVDTASSLGQTLLAEGWQPQFKHPWSVGTAVTPDDDLPALRLSPPDGDATWFVELLGAPEPGQAVRRSWSRLETAVGHFGLPRFRHMPVAVFDPDESPQGLSIARPACMALAHLLEHADPDRTPIAGLEPVVERFVKDVGRAVSLWWLARRQSVDAEAQWRACWDAVLEQRITGDREATFAAARHGLGHLENYLVDAHRLAVGGLLSPHGTTLAAYARAFTDFRRFTDGC